MMDLREKGVLMGGGRRNVHETPSQDDEHQSNTEEACCEVTSFTCQRETRTHFHGVDAIIFYHNVQVASQRCWLLAAQKTPPLARRLSVRVYYCTPN